jgi:hypothetical protein
MAQYVASLKERIDDLNKRVAFLEATPAPRGGRRSLI